MYGATSYSANTRYKTGESKFDPLFGLGLLILGSATAATVIDGIESPGSRGAQGGHEEGGGGHGHDEEHHFSPLEKRLAN